MYRGHKRRGKRAAPVWRVLAGLIAAFTLAFALLDPVFETPAGAAPYGDLNGTPVPAVSVQPSTNELLAQALACHMYFDHHQLVHAQNSIVILAIDPVPAIYLTHVNMFASQEPYPPQKPPRA
jgi:hypothetical protein